LKIFAGIKSENNAKIKKVKVNLTFFNFSGKLLLSFTGIYK